MGGKTAYVFNARLNPNSDYELKISKTLEDIYGNRLEKDSVIKARTGPVSEKDKFVYLGFNKLINVIPSDAKNVINIQSVNADKATVKICETDEI